jgi:hypothetical protein
MLPPSDGELKLTPDERELIVNLRALEPDYLTWFINTTHATLKNRPESMRQAPKLSLIAGGKQT